MSRYRISELAGPTGFSPHGPAADADGRTAGRAADADAHGPPIACSLGASDMTERVREWTDMLGRAAGRREIDGGVCITFPAHAQLIGRLADLAVREQQCCAFLTFAILIAGADRVTLEVRAPHEARQLLPRLFAAA